MEENADAPELKPMDAARLEKVARAIWPNDEDWKERVAELTGSHVTTVRRWMKANKVPIIADRLLECVLYSKVNTAPKK